MSSGLSQKIIDKIGKSKSDIGKSDTNQFNKKQSKLINIGENINIVMFIVFFVYLIVDVKGTLNTIATNNQTKNTQQDMINQLYQNANQTHHFVYIFGHFLLESAKYKRTKLFTINSIIIIFLSLCLLIISIINISTSKNETGSTETILSVINIIQVIINILFKDLTFLQFILFFEKCSKKEEKKKKLNPTQVEQDKKDIYLHQIKWAQDAVGDSMKNKQKIKVPLESQIKYLKYNGPTFMWHIDLIQFRENKNEQQTCNNRSLQVFNKAFENGWNKEDYMTIKIEKNTVNNFQNCDDNNFEIEEFSKDAQDIFWNTNFVGFQVGSKVKDDQPFLSISNNEIKDNYLRQLTKKINKKQLNLSQKSTINLLDTHEFKPKKRIDPIYFINIFDEILFFFNKTIIGSRTINLLGKNLTSKNENQYAVITKLKSLQLTCNSFTLLKMLNTTLLVIPIIFYYKSLKKAETQNTTNFTQRIIILVSFLLLEIIIIAVIYTFTDKTAGKFINDNELKNSIQNKNNDSNIISEIIPDKSKNKDLFDVNIKYLRCIPLFQITNIVLFLDSQIQSFKAMMIISVIFLIFDNLKKMREQADVSDLFIFPTVILLFIILFLQLYQFVISQALSQYFTSLQDYHKRKRKQNNSNTEQDENNKKCFNLNFKDEVQEIQTILYKFAWFEMVTTIFWYSVIIYDFQQNSKNYWNEFTIANCIIAFIGVPLDIYVIFTWFFALKESKGENNNEKNNKRDYKNCCQQQNITIIFVLMLYQVIRIMQGHFYTIMLDEFPFKWNENKSRDSNVNIYALCSFLQRILSLILLTSVFSNQVIYQNIQLKPQNDEKNKIK